MKDIGNSSNFTEDEELFLLRNKQGKIVGIKDLKQANFQETMKDWKKHLPKPSLLSIIIWVAVALLGGLAWSLIALAQGETINAIWFVIAAVCSIGLVKLGILWFGDWLWGAIAILKVVLGECRR